MERLYKTSQHKRDYNIKYYYEHKEQVLVLQRTNKRAWYVRNRERLFQLLGDKCVICGFSDKRALEFDHINGGGSKQRRILRDSNKYMSNKDIHGYYIRRPELAKKELQVLCANCNRIKRCENNECMKKIRSE